MRIRDKRMGDRKAGKFSKLKQLPLELGFKQIYPATASAVLFKEIFINEDRSKVGQYLISTGLALSLLQITITYQKR